MVEMEAPQGNATFSYPDSVLYSTLIFMFCLFAFIGYQGYKVVQDKAKRDAEKAAKAEKKRTGSGKSSRKDK